MNTSEDTRTVPPLGWCAECIREAGWVRAVTTWQGTALCAQHVIFIHGIGDIDIEEENAPLGKPQAVVDALRRGINSRARVAGF
ncbi:hypothetical protein AB0K64_29630 [Streptomyces sp. NPDC053741]|uniref:hypothetical protein n=1 Tax=Streptomyces TaxID=1883 RepID=UPI002F910C96